MNVYIKLLVAGTDTGPFDLYSDVDSFSSAFETGVTRDSLVAGYTSILVPNGTTQIKVQSTGNCTNYTIIDIEISTTSTTSTTTTAILTTTTTTTGLYTELSYVIDAPDCETACPKTNGQILINGVQTWAWSMWTSLPVSGTLHPSIGDIIIINATCFAGGTCAIGMQSTISISINGVICDTATDGDATCTFTFTETTAIDIQPGCLIP